MGDEKATETLSANPRGIERAVGLLRAGGLVAFPTETVYGLGADATNGVAVAKIFEAKGRPEFNPLIVHVADIEQATRLIELPDALLPALALWPGPLTLVAPMRANSGIAPLVTAGLGSVAIRVPDHPVARALLAQIGRPIAAPSANRSGKISPTTAAHVLSTLEGRIDAVVDGGPTQVGLESTIIGVDDDMPVLLRPGGIALEVLEDVLKVKVTSATSGKITAPGQLLSHYAPNCPIRLNAHGPAGGELFLGFGNYAHPDGMTLSGTGDLREAAANLFAHLHALSAKSPKAIAVAPIPQTGLGQAINDRLTRAAAPK